MIETFRRRGYRFNPILKITPQVADLVSPTPDKLGPNRLARRRAVFAVAVLMVFAILVSVFMYRSFPQRAREAVRTSDITIRRLTPDIDIQFSSISPDGKYLVFSKTEAGKESIWLQDIGSGVAKQLSPASSTEGYGGVYFAPDGRNIYFATTRKGVPNTVIMRMPLEGGSPKEIVGNVVSPLAISSDGSKIAFVDGDMRLVVAESDGGAEIIAKTRNSGEAWFESWGSQLSFSPDGSSVVICGGRIENGRRRFVLTEITITDGSERDIPVREWNYLDGVQWIPDGSGLLVIAKEESGSPFQIWRVSYPSGESSRVTRDLVDYSSVSISADSRRMTATQQIRNLNIWIAPMIGDRPPKQITFGPAANDGFHGVESMPNGNIVYTSPRSGNDDIWMMAPDGSNQTQLTSNAGANINPAVSSDGQFIYFLSDRADFVWRVWRMGADGSNPTQLTFGEGSDDRPVISPDGEWIYFVRQKNNTGVIMKVRSSGGEMVEVSRNGNFGLLGISPDGKQLAVRRYDENAKIAWQAGLLSTESGEIVRMFDERVYGRVALSADGSYVIYTDRKQSRNLYRLAIEGGEPQPLTSFESGYIRNFELSADGRSVVISRGRPSREAVLLDGF